jgi:hypothetical protein
MRKIIASVLAGFTLIGLAMLVGASSASALDVTRTKNFTIGSRTCGASTVFNDTAGAVKPKGSSGGCSGAVARSVVFDWCRGGTLVVRKTVNGNGSSSVLAYTWPSNTPTVSGGSDPNVNVKVTLTNGSSGSVRVHYNN